MQVKVLALNVGAVGVTTRRFVWLKRRCGLGRLCAALRARRTSSKPAVHLASAGAPGSPWRKAVSLFLLQTTPRFLLPTTPSVPHASEGGFQPVGEPNSVAKGRVYDKRTQGRPPLANPSKSLASCNAISTYSTSFAA